MSENTGIEWTDHSFNPWWGCRLVEVGGMRREGFVVHTTPTWSELRLTSCRGKPCGVNASSVRVWHKHVREGRWTVVERRTEGKS